jgi:hypothetical protein
MQLSEVTAFATAILLRQGNAQLLHLPEQGGFVDA